jgi:putative ABC transport system ATP-binding protein
MQNLELRALKTAVGPDLSCSIAAGECLVLRGPSGVGKSLLLRAIADLDRHEGDVLLDGVSQDAVAAPLWRRKVLYVATEPGWWSDYVGDHFPDCGGITGDLEKFGFTLKCLEWRVDRLSSGERQRLGLIRALSLRPEVLLLDEPTATLDSVNAEFVEDVVASHRREGMAVLWVSHDENQARRVATHILRLSATEAVAEVVS